LDADRYVHRNFDGNHVPDRNYDFDGYRDLDEYGDLGPNRYSYKDAFVDRDAHLDCDADPDFHSSSDLDDDLDTHGFVDCNPSRHPDSFADAYNFRGWTMRFRLDLARLSQPCFVGCLRGEGPSYQLVRDDCALVDRDRRLPDGVEGDGPSLKPNAPGLGPQGQEWEGRRQWALLLHAPRRDGRQKADGDIVGQVKGFNGALSNEDSDGSSCGFLLD